MAPINSINVKVTKVDNRNVHIRLQSANRELRVPKKQFKTRMERGFYVVENPEMLEEATA